MIARTIIEATLPESSGKLYHGTDKEAAGQAILRDGILKAPSPEDLTARYGSSFQRPVDGQVYFSKSLSYAVVYALGGYLMGTDTVRNNAADNPFGYLFVVSGDTSLSRPDEDSLGYIPSILNNLDFYATYDGRDDVGFKELAKALKQDSSLRDALEREMVRCITPNTLLKARYGEAIWQTKAGKMLLKRMSPSLITKVSPYFTNHGTTSTVPWEQAWRIRKTDAKHLKPDCSNFFLVAERLA